MEKFLRLISIWSKFSLYGIGILLLVILGFLLSDLLLGADFGYERSDLLIVSGIALFTVILFVSIRGMMSVFKR